jgi:hypothetical protein
MRYAWQRMYGRNDPIHIICVPYLLTKYEYNQPQVSKAQTGLGLESHDQRVPLLYDLEYLVSAFRAGFTEQGSKLSIPKQSACDPRQHIPKPTFTGIINVACFMGIEYARGRRDVYASNDNVASCRISLSTDPDTQVPGIGKQTIGSLPKGVNKVL